MLLITIPHAKREASNNHDEGAIRMIPYLKASLDNRNVPYTLLVGDDVFRGVIDLNRGVARNTQYAKDFAKLLKDSKAHIDLHSFEYRSEDASDEDSLTEAGDDVRDWSLSDVVFLTVPKISDPVFAEVLMTAIEKIVEIDDIETQDYNYLTVFSQVAMDVPSALLELNEDSLPSYPAIAEVVAEAVESYFALADYGVA
jgi:hypothetical protein